MATYGAPSSSPWGWVPSAWDPSAIPDEPTFQAPPAPDAAPPAEPWGWAPSHWTAPVEADGTPPVLSPPAPDAPDDQAGSPVPDVALEQRPETTALLPADETAFQAWATKNGIRDVDHPDSHYDYRGFYKATGGAPHPAVLPGGERNHFPDTFKQHGHETFSTESQYSTGPFDGGTWGGADGNTYAPSAGAPIEPGHVFDKTLGYDADAMGRELAAMGDTETFADSPYASADDRSEQEKQARIDDEAKRLGAMSDEERATYFARKQGLEDSERTRLQLENSERDRKALEDSVAIREKARAQAQAELADVQAKTKAMADSSPFESWWGSRTGLQKAGGIIAAFMGGWLQGQGKTGGRNPALDQMMKLAQDTADAQWNKLRERRGLAQDALAGANDEFSAREQLRIASFHQFESAIESKIAQLDPEGTAAVNGYQALAQVRAARQAAEGALGDKAFDRYVKLGQLDVEQRNAASEEQKAADAHALAQHKLAGGAGGGVGSGYGSAVTYEVIKANGWTMPAGLQPGQAIPAKQYKAFLDTAEKNGQINSNIANQNRADLDVKLKANAVTVTDPTTGGDLFQARTEKEAEIARSKVFAARQIVNMMDEVMAIRDRVGGETSWGNSDDYQRLQVLKANLQMLRKDGTQGMSSENDMKILSDTLGASSPASLRARAAGLKRGRQAVMAQLNGYLHDGQGYQGAPIVFRNQFATPKAKPDPDVDALVSREDGGRVPVVKDAGTGPSGPARPVGASGPAGPALPSGGGAVDLDATAEARAAETPEETARLDAELTAAQQTALDNLKAGVEKGDADAARKLAQVAADPRTNRRASFAAMHTLALLAAGGNQTALDAMKRSVGDEDGE